MIWRAFLSPARTGVDSYVTVNDGPYSCDLKIADCNRTISLSFYSRGEKEKKVALEKLARLRTALDKIEFAIERQRKD